MPAEFSFEITVEIAAPVEEAFAFFEDPRSMLKSRTAYQRRARSGRAGQASFALRRGLVSA